MSHFFSGVPGFTPLQTQGGVRLQTNVDHSLQGVEAETGAQGSPSNCYLLGAITAIKERVCSSFFLGPTTHNNLPSETTALQTSEHCSAA